MAEDGRAGLDPGAALDLLGDVLADPRALRWDGLVHVLGNLTLVNETLNPAMSNRPWTAQEAAARGLGDHGKRDYLLQHS
jgi:hypothetical protein